MAHHARTIQVLTIVSPSVDRDSSPRHERCALRRGADWNLGARGHARRWESGRRDVGRDAITRSRRCPEKNAARRW